jgi:hypothetical protein
LESVLASLAREVDGARGGTGDPITTGALVRIAVTGLAEHRSALHGATEAELLASWLAFLGERQTTAGR